MTYNKLDSNYIVKAEEWQLVSHINELLETFYKLKPQCSKNNALLSSVFPYAEVLTFFNFKANSPSGQSGFTTLATLAENIEEAFERRLYTTNNS